MGSLCVVASAPIGDDDLGLEQGVKELAVEELVAHGSVEALDEGVLLGAALLDEGDGHPLLDESAGERRRNELATVVGAEDLRLAAFPKTSMK